MILKNDNPDCVLINDQREMTVQSFTRRSIIIAAISEKKKIIIILTDPTSNLINFVGLSTKP